MKIDRRTILKSDIHDPLYNRCARLIESLVFLGEHGSDVSRNVLRDARSVLDELRRIEE